MAEIGSYLYIAQRDLANAKDIQRENLATLCGRTAEQAVEKALKAFLASEGDETDYKLLNTHKPFRVYSRCVKYGFALELSNEELHLLKNLDSYYYDTNYPGNDFFEISLNEAVQSVQLAEKIVRYVTDFFMQELGDEESKDFPVSENF